MSDQELAQMSDKLQLKPPPRRMLAAAIGKLRQSVTQHGGAATEQAVEPEQTPIQPPRHSSQLKRNAEELVRNNADVLSPAIRARCGAMRIPKLDHENP